MLAAPAALVALAALLVGCSAPESAPPRTRPNAVERSAAAVAAGNSVQAQLDGADWIQLWTPNQAGGVIERCVHIESDDVLAIMISPPGRGGVELSFEYGVVGELSSLKELPSGFQSPARLVDRCVATTPIDARRLLVPRKDAAALYSYDVTSLRRCLLEHGHSVPPVPDRASYESLLRGNSPWSPYDQVRVHDRAAWYALSDACPALPTAIAADVATTGLPSWP
jgi:hypothetical protein